MNIPSSLFWLNHLFTFGSWARFKLGYSYYYYFVLRT